MPKSLPLTSVNHVGLMTVHLDESIAFYRDVLGFRLVDRPNFDFPGCWLFNCGIMIHLIHNEATEGSDQRDIDTRGNHLAIHSDDLETVEARLGEWGIAFRKNEIVDRGIKQIFFHDPDGHHVEIGTYPPVPPFVD